MEKYALMLLCQYGSDTYTQEKCQEVLKSTVRQWQIYQTLKEHEKEYRELAEYKLSKPGFWAISTILSTASTQKLYLSGHNFMGIDSVNLQLGKKSEVSLTWTF